MKLPALALLALLAVSAAGAQPVPAGVGLIAFKEKLDVASDCEPYSGEGYMLLTVFPNGTFRTETAEENVVFSGELVPADASGRWWRLRFDEASRSLYRLYLASGASVLCEAPISIEREAIESFALRLRRGGTLASLTLRTLARGSSGHLRHQITGRGAFVLDTRGDIPPSGGGAGVVIISYDLGAITGQ